KDALRAELQLNYDKAKQEIYDRRIAAIEKLTEQKAAIYREYQETYKKLEELRSKRNLIKYGPDAMVPNEFSEANIELAKQINKELHKVIKKGQATEAQKAEFNKNAELISDYSKYSTYRENYVDTE